MNTKLLRQKILDLAIRGKLVPQDPNDEPASVLLEKIRAEKERLIKEKKIKPDKSKNTADRSNYRNEQPFEIPESWEWVKLGEIAQHNVGKTLNKSENNGEIREYITTSNLYWGRFDFTELRTMPIEVKELSKCSAIKGDLLICEGGDAGRSAIWNYEHTICFQNHIHRVRPYGGISIKYLYYHMYYIYHNDNIKQYLKGVGIQSLSGNSLASIILPLPPLNEQIRIVDEIEKLFELIDIIEENKISLEEHITLTKSKVLDLAIRGKLVPQDPSDEPASVLLERIHKGKRVTSDKTNYPFEVPHGWVWCQLEEISKTLSTKPFQILQSEIQKLGNYPVISQSSNFIEGYSDKEENLFKLKPVIIFGDHTRNVKYVDFEFIVGADGVKILIPQNIYSKYFYYLILKGSEAIENKGYSRHFKFLRSILYPLPPLNEQKRIVSQIETIFAQLDIIEDSLKE